MLEIDNIESALSVGMKMHDLFTGTNFDDWLAALRKANPGLVVPDWR